MGNAHGQLGERRKSRGAADNFDGIGASHVRRASGGSTGGGVTMATGPPRRGHHYGEAEPLSIGVEVTESAKKIPAHRPRATTEVGRPAIRKPKLSVDVPETDFSSLHASFKRNEGAKTQAEKPGKEGKPTIFKFSNNKAKEVYVCGKTSRCS